MDRIHDLGTDAVALVVREQYRRLVQAVAAICGSLPDAEDAVQEAFAKAWERAARGESFDHLPGWIVTVALNQTRSGHRRRTRQREVVTRLGQRQAIEAAGVGIGIDGLTSGALAARAAIDGLPRRQREVVLMHYFLDFDIATIASSLGISPGTVKTALFRAREKLAVALGEPEAAREAREGGGGPT
jgi:RNA polymerase sigma factor (sigma-70 family)